ncbi:MULTISPECIES: mycofactocin biosynthesis chaperone MftB [unclassified Rhodococcus (in: high G+C Gram-positive bacteria)]|uniref:mycofactocin biosynthesis chaperone MftB n=1 Tax=unclassified Rhodococcus (in: high G+C Gram-positive bacteria) TaxID=192944 RepID=UPI0004877EDF|nr:MULTISPECIES: mycofactocin biosynthesis chaperone MftB [unclassified Rhodococcus (in: high G+C Gram-positive bacteria)]MDQ1203175.1 putative mycofactocin binding protein MftB [Rhodococcus sp. SORGH_AS_0303]
MTDVLAASPRTVDLALAWQLNPQVALRPEPFGALLYHFGTRKLSFLKNAVIVSLVTSLSSHPDARSAMSAMGIEELAIPRYAQALAALADSTMIVPTPVKEGPA